MDTQRIESFKQFAKYLEYPMVVFEAESGKVLDINYEAEVLLGSKVSDIHIQPGRTFTTHNFWDVLHGKKSLIWHRIRMVADQKEYLVSGLINEMTEAGTLIYSLLFERRADLNIGSLTLENIVNHAGIVAIHIGRDVGNSDLHVEYVSQNVNRYGYTRGQLYDKNVKLWEIVCPDDYERVRNAVLDAARLHLQEDTFECRILTEEREVIPVRLLLRYLYDDYEKLTDIEILLIDLRESYHRNLENSYLSNAITKMKNVVIVKLYHAGKRKLQYISPNAYMIGMNIEALRKGYKLTEDYIHPDDRDTVLDAVYQAVANGVTDYTQKYRMVTDDGRQIWVENEVTVNRVSDGEAEISFLITDVTEEKQIENEIVASKEEQEPFGEVFEPTSQVETEPFKTVSVLQADDENLLQQLEMMQCAVTLNGDFYAVVLDTQGKQLTKPSGPAQDMGLFYDLAERPLFKDKFAFMSQQIREKDVPLGLDFAMDHLKVSMVLAPLMVDEEVVAYWLLTSFSNKDMERLNEVITSQWKLANVIVNNNYSQKLNEKQMKQRKKTDMQLRREQESNKLIEELIVAMSKTGNSALREMCHKLSVHLSIDNIGVYTEEPKNQHAQRIFTWSQSGEDKPFFATMELSKQEYDVMKKQFEDADQLKADYGCESSFLREMAKQTQMTVVVHRLCLSHDTQGYVAFGIEDRNRQFDSADLRLMDIFSKVLQGYMIYQHKQEMRDVVQSGMLESYNYIRDAVYVKDNCTGEIIFANKAADKLFGYSLIGLPASDVINDRMDQYRQIGGVRRRFVDNRKVVKWQTYMKELDQIMNIVEVHLETLYGADWSLIILKKNKNRTQNPQNLHD